MITGHNTVNYNQLKEIIENRTLQVGATYKIVPTGKMCSKCKRDLSLDKFVKCRSNKDGLNHRCIECEKEKRVIAQNFTYKPSKSYAQILAENQERNKNLKKIYAKKGG